MKGAEDEPWSNQHSSHVRRPPREGNQMAGASAFRLERYIAAFVEQLDMPAAKVEDPDDDVLLETAGSPALLATGQGLRIGQSRRQGLEGRRPAIVRIDQAEIEALASLIDVGNAG